jgi:SAM-dependent methyltransferase
MKLDQVVPWGRTLEEYKLMFNLSAADLNSRILGCGDGPASFNFEMRQLGYSVVSIDPIYNFSAKDIRQRVEATYETVISQVKENSHRYNWQNFRDADDLGNARLAAMENFLLDYELGKNQGYYLPQSLPNLNFNNNQFDLCLCSHLLFLYSEQLSLEFHLTAIHELLRISSEIRIFPLLQLDCQISPYVEIVIKEFDKLGFEIQVESVNYEFQKGGNKMLKINRTQ